MKKFLSRKFLYPIIFGVLVFINRAWLGEVLGETELILLAGIIISFIIGESVIDVKRESNK